MSDGILNEFSFNPAAATQAWSILWRRHKFGTGEVQVALTWALLRQTEAASKLEFRLEIIGFQPINGGG